MFGLQKRLKEDMRIIGSDDTSMGIYTDTIIFLIRAENLLKPYPSIFITVPKAMFVRV
jgi:hypothetical protein